MADEPQLLKVEEVAERLGLTRDTAYNLCYQRKLPCIAWPHSARPGRRAARLPGRSDAVPASEAGRAGRLADGR